MAPGLAPALAAGLSGGPLALALLLGRRGPAAAWALLIAAAVAGWRLGVYTAAPSLLLEWPWSPLALALGWLLVGAAARRCGGLSLGPSLGLSALIGGALLGDVAAAGLIAGQVEDPRRAARAALVASAGAALSGIGTPATLLVARPGAIWPAALLCAAVAWPRGPGGARPAGRTGLTAGLAIAALISWWSPAGGLALAGGALLIAGAVPRLGRREALAAAQLAAVAGLSWLAWRSGALGIAERGLGWAAALPGGGALPALAGWLAGAAGGEPAAALALAALGEAPLRPSWPGLGAAAAAGLSAGGLGPLLACGGLRAGWRIWLLQGATVAAWAALSLPAALP